jgi:hypothetical protein
MAARNKKPPSSGTPPLRRLHPIASLIRYAGYLKGEGEHLTYSNIDIGVQAPFYLKLARQLQVSSR